MHKQFFKYFLVFVLCLPFYAVAEEGSDKSLVTKIDYIVTNLQGDESKYLQVEMTLKLAHAEVGAKIETYMPVIRHQLIMLLSSKTAEELKPTEAKRKLLKDAQQTINQALKLDEKSGVSKALFTSFIIQ